MINLPFKQILITDFKLHELVETDYNFNSEFEQSYKKEFEKKFRIVEFKMPEDTEVLSCRYFTLQTDGLDIFSEFTKHVKKDWLIRFICKHEDWKKVKEFEFGYFYLTEELVEIRNEMKQMEEKFNKKVIELNEI